MIFLVPALIRSVTQVTNGVSNETPVRTVFFEYLIVRWTRGGGGLVTRRSQAPARHRMGAFLLLYLSGGHNGVVRGLAFHMSAVVPVRTEVESRWTRCECQRVLGGCRTTRPRSTEACVLRRAPCLRLCPCVSGNAAGAENDTDIFCPECSLETATTCDKKGRRWIKKIYNKNSSCYVPANAAGADGPGERAGYCADLDDVNAVTLGGVGLVLLSLLLLLCAAIICCKHQRLKYEYMTMFRNRNREMTAYTVPCMEDQGEGDVFGDDFDDEMNMAVTNERDNDMFLRNRGAHPA